MSNITDFENIKKEIYDIANVVKKEHFHKLKTHEQIRAFGKGSITTKVWQYYNLFSFNKPELNKLFEDIKKFFVERYNPTCDYYISAWVNIHKKDEFLDWHWHWETEKQTYHGYVAIQSEPSNTSYIFPGQEGIYVHNNKNGLIMLNKSEGDQHCVSIWKEDFDRISVAFDIVPTNQIDINSPTFSPNMIPFFKFNQ
jgi:hypothetical protein